MYVKPRHQNMDSDNIGQLLDAIGLVNDISNVTLDAILLIIFAIVLHYFPKTDTNISQDLISIPIHVKNYYSIFVSKYSCLAIMCISGIMVPSIACCVYYILFAVLTTVIVLFKPLNKTIACLFRAICFYTSLHIFVLFSYQIEWIHNLKINMNLKQFGLIAFHSSKCYTSEVLPELELNNYLLPILLFIQHFTLWSYSNMISENTSIENSIKSKESLENKFKFIYIILEGINTIGFKIAILIWCICYPGWLTFIMLLWTIVFWMHLNSRGNLIVILFLAISTLLFEYTYLVTGNDLLKQTLFTVTFWIALDEVLDKSNKVRSKLWSINSNYYISYTWTILLILIMIIYGFFGYHKINYIQIGYIMLALLFLTIFQVSFQVWSTIVYLYWTIVVLYSIIVIAITYVFQFYGFADILITHLHISNDMQRDIGLDKTDSFKTIVPATIAIAILLQFQYFNRHLTNSLNMKIPIDILKTSEEPHEIEPYLSKEIVFSKILNTLIIVFHVHLNKLLIMFVVMLIMSKPCFLNIILLITMLLWILMDYNKFMTNILFLYNALYIMVILAYQFSFCNHELYTYKFRYYPQKPPSLIFPNITYTDMNKGIPELFMYLANSGFSLFGLEITFTTITITIYLSLDMCGLLCALWLLSFIVKSRKSVSTYWIYFVIFTYLVIIFKYVLCVETIFNHNSEIPWKTINIIDNVTIQLYDEAFDFILLVFASHQLAVFRKESLQISYENHFQENNNTTHEDIPDYLSQNKTYLDILKKTVFNNSMWFILFFIFWTGTSHVNIFSLGYLCAGTIFFWKGTHYFLMPLDMILRIWNGLLEFTIVVIFIKALLHLLGCLVLKYFEWYSCIFMRVFSIFCCVKSSEKQICGTSKNDSGLFFDVFIFTLVLFQRRFFKSEHFLNLIDDTKAVAVLASKMCHIVNEWERTKKDESRQIDLDSLEKIRAKLNNIRQSKKRLSQTQTKHFRACLDGEFMFEKIYDDVYLVVKYDTHIFSKYYGDSVNGSWLYRQFVYFVFYLTEQMNSYSEKHRQIMETLNAEKTKLMKDSKLLKLGQHKGASMLWTPMKNIINITDYKMRYYEDANKDKHWFKQFILAIWNVIQSSTHLFCYLGIFYNTAHNTFDSISMIPVVMVICWGQLSVPRPTKTFWIVLITYMQITGLVKYICSFKEIPWTQEELTLKNTSSLDFYSYPTMRLGIGDYQSKILTDLIVLLVLFVHRRTLVRLGLWTCNKHHTQWVANTTILQYKNQKISSFRMIIFNIKTHLRPIYEFYQDLRHYHTEGTVNVYPTMFLLIFMFVPFEILNLNKIRKLLSTCDYTVTESFDINRVTKLLLITFSINVVIIVIDRWFYAKRFVVGKLIFHIFFIIIFLLEIGWRDNSLITSPLLAFNIYLYISVSAYQIRNGYLYRHASSFLWSRYTLFNLLAYKLYYYCPFVHEIRTVLDWIWTDSSLTIMEWFKMDELFTHVCCVKSILNFRDLVDGKRGKHVSWIFKLCVGGGIILGILIIIIFPMVWFSMFESKPDTPSSMELTVTFGEDLTVFSSKSDDIHRLDVSDLRLIKDIYLNCSNINRNSISEFLLQYEYDEISSMNVIPQSINSRPITTYEFNKFKKIILTSPSIKISVEWALTHHDGVKVSRGKNTVMMHDYTHSILIDCLNHMLNKSSSDVPAKPYMDVGLTFHYDDVSKFSYWWDFVEICPDENEDTSYLSKLPYSSCADNEKHLVTTNNTHMNIMYNIYVFSDRYSSTMQFLDDRGIVGLYTIIVVYFGYKFAFDIFRSFKFKLGYTETPYPDRILQLCYEIYMVRFFGEYEMEEDLYAIL
ncbi:hypothetical protein AGLY_014438, partial [Aphis glycines]